MLVVSVKRTGQSSHRLGTGSLFTPLHSGLLLSEKWSPDRGTARWANSGPEPPVCGLSILKSSKNVNYKEFSFLTSLKIE